MLDAERRPLRFIVTDRATDCNNFPTQPAKKNVFRKNAPTTRKKRKTAPPNAVLPRRRAPNATQKRRPPPPDVKKNAPTNLFRKSADAFRFHRSTPFSIARR